MLSRLFASRYLILVCAVLMQFCLGSMYAWSVFVDPLRETLGLGQGIAQAPFTIFFVVFAATALMAGPAMKRLTPRGSALLGGVLCGCGWMLASLGTKGFVFTTLGIGVMAGVGVGLAYVVPIAMCVQWFPKRKGMATGIAVAGFGGGAAGVSQLADWLMRVHGLSAFGVFQVLGVFFLIVVCLSGLVMRRPPEGEEGRDEVGPNALPAQTPRFLETISKRSFQILYVAMFCGLTAGLLVSANLKQLSSLTSDRAGVAAVSLFALANAAGRIGWGVLFDRFDRSVRVLQANLLCQAALFLSSSVLLGTDFGLQTIALVAGFNYGGVMVLYASSVASRWGAANVGHVYGWMFSANIPAALAPLLGGFARDLTGTFAVPLLLGAVLLVLGATGIGVLTARPPKVSPCPS